MEFSLLGPLVVRHGGKALPVRRGHQRALLATLLLDANHAVSMDTITEMLWGADPPPSAEVTVRNYVSRLRRELGEAGRARIMAQAGGYLISVGAAELDVSRFEDLLGAARAAAGNGCWDQAATHAGSALSLWRGKPLADVESPALTQREVPRLAEMRLQVLETRINADLCLGRNADVIAELQHLVGAHPLREPLHALLMLALFRDGREAEALAAYQHAREVLVEELGTEPGTRLRELHGRILASDPALPGDPALADPEPAPPAVAPPVPAVPRQLPGTVQHFVGRKRELAELTRMLDDAGQAPGAAAITVIAGTPGAGKTALAVCWAHQAASRFPDGQLYVNLRGYDPGQPVAASEALAGFLYALGMAGRDIPPGEDQRAAVYRSLVVGRRMLIVLDNACEPRQVRPLLPASPTCAVIVTSRDSLAGLVARDGARRLDLEVLPSADAVIVLRDLIGERAAADPEATLALAKLCGRLPLALRVLAELATARAAVSLSELAAELADRERRLDLLDAGQDPGTAVREVLSWSCDQLKGETRRAFRLLALHPATGFDRYAAAALVGSTLQEVERMLSVLANAHLIQHAGPGRYGMHDLLRDYACEQATIRDGAPAARMAMSRLLAYYSYTAATAMNVLYPAERVRRPMVSEPATPVPAFAGERSALAWLDAERASLIAVAARPVRGGWADSAISLAVILSRYLEFGGYYAEAEVISGYAYHAACDVGDQVAEATALIHVADTDHLQSNFKQATRRYRRALALCHQVGDQHGQARILANLGFIDILQGRYRQAAGRLQQALDVGHGTGDRAGTARVLRKLGSIAIREGQHSDAAARLQQALIICRAIGDRYGEAETQAALGTMKLRQGYNEQATECQRLALGLFRDLGYRLGEAEALCGLGETLLHGGQPDRAIAHFTAARSIADHIQSEEIKARAGEGLGDAFRALHDLARARRCWQEALTRYTPPSRNARGLRAGHGAH